MAALLAPRRSRRANRKRSVAAQAQSGDWEKMAVTSFEQMGLDTRLLRVRGGVGVRLGLRLGLGWRVLG